MEGVLAGLVHRQCGVRTSAVSVAEFCGQGKQESQAQGSTIIAHVYISARAHRASSR